MHRKEVLNRKEVLLDELLAKFAATKEPPIAQALPKQPEDYTGGRLARVRKQLDALDGLIDDAMAEGDSKRLKELSEAQNRLSEQERIMAGRPLPGSKRPQSEQRARGFASLNDSIVAHDPTPPASPAPNNPTSLSSDSVNP